MVVASNKNAGRASLDMESSKLLTQRAVILILMVMVLPPFVLSCLFISHITFLPTVEHTELPASPSSWPAEIATSVDDEDQTDQEKDGGDSLENRQQRLVGIDDPIKLIDSSVGKRAEIATSVDDEDQTDQEKDGGDSLENRQQRLVGIDDPIKLIDFSVGNENRERRRDDESTSFRGFVDNYGRCDVIDESGGCNIWKGNWIPHDAPPAYTNATCEFIQGHQNCIKNGRPDNQYLQWRWKPHDCELPLFDAYKFLMLVQGKAWAFVGDSISRNHFQSFLCFLAQVEYPKNLYRDDKDLFVRWFFPSYNFTLAVFWSPFWVQWTEDDVEGLPSGTEKLHLDVVDKEWVSSIQEYDYLVLSGGQWFMKSSIYFINNKVVGCHYCPGTNFTQLGFYYGFETALRTMYDFLVSSSYKGVVFFRTFTPDHFENGQWHEGGNCMKTTPTHNATLGGVTMEMYKIQLKEFGRALQSSNHSINLKIVDTIHASIVRADAHPGPYRNVGSSRNDLPQDCLHWCLPGAIDTWSAMLLEMLRHA